MTRPTPQFLSKVWRFALYKDSGPTFYWTRLQAVEHEAYATLRARDAGVRVASVVTAATAGPGVALLVERRVDGTHLAELDPASVTAGLLDDLWSHVARLHDAHLAHGELNAGHVVVDDEGPTISASPARRWRGWPTAVPTTWPSCWRRRQQSSETRRQPTRHGEESDPMPSFVPSPSSSRRR